MDKNGGKKNRIKCTKRKTKIQYVSTYIITAIREGYCYDCQTPVRSDLYKHMRYLYKCYT